MGLPPEQPILQLGTRKSRKFGRYDFKRFDHRSSSHAGIGYAQFDKVEVDCKFLFKKSQWGVFGDHKNPAGIIYLDLNFRQPKDCQLHSATVIVTLDDEDEELQAMHNKLRRRGSVDFQCPIQITDCYGPKEFTGTEKTVQMKKSLHLTPSGQIMGYGFGGLGLDTEATFTYSSRWKFSGHLHRGKGSHWAYKTLKWDLSENDLETDPTHSNEVHTAFTFEHSGQPFFMRVEIEGRLKKFHGRVKNKLEKIEKLLKFPSHAKKEDGSVVTLINFGERISFKNPLDERALELEFEMEMANMRAIPMKVSDLNPVTFQDITQKSGLSNTSNTTASSGSLSQQQSSIPGGSLQQQLPTSTQTQSLPGAGSCMRIQDTTDPMLVNLAQAFVDLHTLDQQLSPQNDSKNPSSITVFANTEIGKNGTDDGIEGQQEFLSEEQMLLQLLKIAFLQIISRLLGLLGQTPTPTPPSSTVGKEGGPKAAPSSS